MIWTAFTMTRTQSKQEERVTDTGGRDVFSIWGGNMVSDSQTTVLKQKHKNITAPGYVLSLMANIWL